MIVFNKPAYLGCEEDYVLSAIKEGRLCGDGKYSHLCEQWIEENLHCKKALLTPSCTSALELAALLINIQPGDEVIMPSYTFVSTANAFALRGAKIIFIDVDPATMNMDAGLIESAITEHTRAIVPVHYAGVACEMETIMSIAKRHNLYVIEDAAQALMAFYKGKPLGTIGHFGCYSFHETKNYTSGGEGGALLINDEKFIERAEIIREKGTDRSRFLKGQVDKYTWRDIGSSYLPSELQAAYLYAQLLNASVINERRLLTWQLYHQALHDLEKNKLLKRPELPTGTQHNAHMYYIRLVEPSHRDKTIAALKEKGVQTVFHYVPLHSSPAGIRFGHFYGCDRYTTLESSKLIRLPLWYNLSNLEIEEIISKVIGQFGTIQ